MEGILFGREQRVKARNEFISKFTTQDVSFISATVNMPGKDKNSPFVFDIFREILRVVNNNLVINKIEVIKEEKAVNKAGPCAFWAVKLQAEKLKEICIEIEQSHLLGRLFDLDVLSNSTQMISRTDLGYLERKCLLCDNPAKLCIRLKRHSAEELTAKLAEYKDKFYCQKEKQEKKAAAKIEQLAYNAIINEVVVTPKPGLVDLNDSGSHTDMNIGTFIDSSIAIKPYFYKFAQVGMDFSLEDKQIFLKLRQIGQEAEQDMFKATEGVNTQKGIIFSLGLLTAAAGRLWAEGDFNLHVDLVQKLVKLVSSWVEGLTEKELKALPPEQLRQVKSGCCDLAVERNLTHGQLVYLKYGFSGARGEAEQGFPHVINYGLPTFKSAVSREADFNQAALQALLSIMSQVNDTNILIRSDLQTLKQVKKLAREVINSGGVFADTGGKKIEELTKLIVEKQISPGGAADLLAVTLFIYGLEKSVEQGFLLSD